MREDTLQDIATLHRDEILKACVALTAARTTMLVERYTEQFKRDGAAPEVLVRFPTPLELDALARLVATIAVAERRRLRGLLFTRLSDNKEKARKTDIYDELRKELFPEINEENYLGKAVEE